ncbi:MAG: CehA/McbA family metallohydrolase [Verrucomicrobia bacterium]|nr:CehA/McbA family metallohydrolase [Verrucomicrobiota bacterium]
MKYLISRIFAVLAWCLVAAFCLKVDAQNEVPVVSDVEGQPLGANVKRLISALEYLGAPLSEEVSRGLKKAADDRDAEKVQQVLDKEVLFVVDLNPEVRVKVRRGPGKAVLQQGGFTPFLVKVINGSTVAGRLQIVSPQAGAVYSGAAISTLKRMAQTELNDNENKKGAADRFLDVEMFRSPPMTDGLSGLRVEYAIALIYSSESGKREATIGFDVGAGTQDLGFRGEVPVLFDIKKASLVKLTIKDADGQPTSARLIFRDKQGHVYPSQAKRLAPDLFFQPQIYRHSGEVVLLPPGELSVEYCRGPEYEVLKKDIEIAPGEQMDLELSLKRWVDPMKYGFYCGDHHIHAAGCAHYTSPSEGVTPKDVFLQVKGEGLNVGCILTWGYGWEYQRAFFSPEADKLSEPLTLIKYDLEVSGFGSAAMGHVCLLNLKDQVYPGTEGNMKGWPTWTVPVLRWCKEQGGVTGYPHSSLRINPETSAKETMLALDKNKDGLLSKKEVEGDVLPAAFEKIDSDKSQALSERELLFTTNEVLDQLPNLAIPAMMGGGALEIFVSTTEGVCDFISAMDTDRIGEWNTWYHLMNSGFSMKVSGETDYPCMSSRRVGKGRVYVQLGELKELKFEDWIRGVEKGQSYVSDGYAHALKFSVNGEMPGRIDVELGEAGTVQVEATVSFASELPKAVAYGQITPAAGRRIVGDTVNLHAERTLETVKGGKRLVEIVVNGKAVASQYVPADGKAHDLKFDVKVGRSSWVALRHFPQLHTNPVNVIVAGKPIRASRDSALYCAEAVKRLWKNHSKRISKAEKGEAEKAYQRAIKTYEQRAVEAGGIEN